MPPDVDVEVLYAVPDNLPETLPETAWVWHRSLMVDRFGLEQFEVSLMNYVTAEWFWPDTTWPWQRHVSARGRYYRQLAGTQRWFLEPP